MSSHGHAGWQKRDAFKDSTTADAERSSSAHGNGRRRVHSTSRSNHSEPPHDEQPRARMLCKRGAAHQPEGSGMERHGIHAICGIREHTCEHTRSRHGGTQPHHCLTAACWDQSLCNCTFPALAWQRTWRAHPCHCREEIACRRHAPRATLRTSARSELSRPVVDRSMRRRRSTNLASATFHTSSAWVTASRRNIAAS